MFVSLMITMFSSALLAILGSPSLSITAAERTTRSSDRRLVRRFVVTLLEDGDLL